MKNNFTNPEDCQKCGQTIANCECHISDELKHSGLHLLITKLLGDGYGKCKYVHMEGASCSLNNNCRYPNCILEDN